MNLRTICLAAMSLFAAASGHAQSAAQDSRIYYGANLGLNNSYQIDCKTGFKCDKTGSMGGKIYAGTDLDNYGVEALIYGIKSAQGQLKNAAGTAQQGSVNQIGLGIMGVLPLRYGDFTAKAKFGVVLAKGKATFDDGKTSSKSGLALAGGLGASYAINKDISLNVDLDLLPAKYGKGTVHTRMLSAGVSIKF